jgi:hypothetical protein
MQNPFQNRTEKSIMIPVSDKEFALAGECKPHGFKFYYRPDDAAYGVGITTDGTIPQLHSIEEALRVGKSLQLTIFGQPAVEMSLTYV